MIGIQQLLEFFNDYGHIFYQSFGREYIEKIFGFRGSEAKPLVEIDRLGLISTISEFKSGIYRFDISFGVVAMKPIYILVGPSDSYVICSNAGSTFTNKIKFPDVILHLFYPKSNSMKELYGISPMFYNLVGIKYIRIGDLNLEAVPNFLFGLHREQDLRIERMVLEEIFVKLELVSYAIFHYYTDQEPKLFEICSRFETARRIFEEPEGDLDVIGGKLIMFTRDTPETKILEEGRLLEVFGFPK